MKRCSKCGETKDFSEFYKSTQTTDGYNGWCRQCHSIARSIKYAENPTPAKERSKRRRLEKPETVLQEKREYYQKNKERLNAGHRQYYAERKEQFKEYADKHRERRKAKRRERSTRRMIIDPVFRAIETVRRTILAAAKRGSFEKKGRTAQLLGCTPEEFLSFVGRKPEGNFHLDHICPISQAKTQKEFELLQHYSNLRWLPASENLAKSDNWTLEGHLLCWDLLGRDWID